MNRCVFVMALLAVSLGIAVHAAAAAPEGPRLALSASRDGSGAENESSEVSTTGPFGEGTERLVSGLSASIGDTLSWSADGNRLAFAVSEDKGTALGRSGTGWPVVGVTEADGTSTRVFPRAFLNAGEPVMAPDGRSIAFQRLKFAGYEHGEGTFKSLICLLDVENGSVRCLTRWRHAGFLDPISYSPDGSTLVAVHFDVPGPRIVAVDLRSRYTHSLAVLPHDAYEPSYSPDRSRLAFVRVKFSHAPDPPVRPISELVVARADGSGAKRLLRRKGYISSPSWDPSGSRLAFTRDPPAKGTGLRGLKLGNKVMAINADGTCLTRVFSDPGVAVSGVAWQPGIGRGAGPISC